MRQSNYISYKAPHGALVWHMEIIGVGASVAQLAELSGHVLLKVCKFCTTIKDAPIQVTKIREELQGVTSVLQSLSKIEEDKRIALVLQTFRLERTAIEFNEVLKNIERRLGPERIKGFGRLIWPFTKAEIDRVLLRLERFKGTFSLALNLHHR